MRFDALHRHESHRPKLARAALDFAEKESAPMPRLLEIGLHCQRYSCTPDKFGLDVLDPRLIRNINLAVNVYQSASERKQYKKKMEWDKSHPSQARLLREVRQEESKNPDPYEVRVSIPERPK